MLTIKISLMNAKTILVIDDEIEIRDVAAMRLCMAGYKVTQAIDGQDALDKLSIEMPDAIVMDSRMPRKDGMVVLTELKRRADTCHIPVVMLSASLIDKRRALDNGARFFIAKPYKGADLLEAIRVSMNEPTPSTSTRPIRDQPL